MKTITEKEQKLIEESTEYFYKYIEEIRNNIAQDTCRKITHTEQIKKFIVELIIENMFSIPRIAWAVHNTYKVNFAWAEKLCWEVYYMIKGE